MKGIKAYRLSSRPIHIINQLFLEIEIRIPINRKEVIIRL